MSSHRSKTPQAPLERVVHSSSNSGSTASGRASSSALGARSTTESAMTSVPASARTQPLTMKTPSSRLARDDNSSRSSSTASTSSPASRSDAETTSPSRASYPRYGSPAAFLSPAMRSSYQSETFDMAMGYNSSYGYGFAGGRSAVPPSPVIVTSKATGFAWNRDVFLSRYGQERAGLEEDYGSGSGHGQRVEAHEIHLDEDDLMFDF